jgi:uncharacterized FlaG/YvyC family protein
MDSATLMTGMTQGVSAWDAKSGRREAAGKEDARSEAPTTPATLKLEAEPPVKPSVSTEQIELMRDEINRSARNKLQIDRADDNGRFIYRILDPETGETMRQWPPERYLELVEYLTDKRGGLLDESV